MAHFAILDGSNIVTSVVVIGDSDCLDGSNNESEAVGVTFCETLWGAGNYKQTSYNHNIRKNFASIGYNYDPDKDAFISPKPFASWTLVNATCQWKAPVDLPSDQPESSLGYEWNEAGRAWVAISA